MVGLGFFSCVNVFGQGVLRSYNQSSLHLACPVGVIRVNGLLGLSLSTTVHHLGARKKSCWLLRLAPKNAGWRLLWVFTVPLVLGHPTPATSLGQVQGRNPGWSVKPPAFPQVVPFLRAVIWTPPIDAIWNGFGLLKLKKTQPG